MKQEPTLDYRYTRGIASFVSTLRYATSRPTLASVNRVMLDALGCRFLQRSATISSRSDQGTMLGLDKLADAKVLARLLAKT